MQHRQMMVVVVVGSTLYNVIEGQQQRQIVILVRTDLVNYLFYRFFRIKLSTKLRYNIQKSRSPAFPFPFSICREYNIMLSLSLHHSICITLQLRFIHIFSNLTVAEVQSWAESFERLMSSLSKY